MSNFLQRTIFGAVYVVLIIGAFFTNVYFLQMVMLALMLLSLKEYYNLIFTSKSIEYRVIGFFIGIVCFIAQTIDSEMFAWVMLGGFLFSLAAAFILKTPNVSKKTALLWAGGMLYIVVPLCLITYYHNSVYYTTTGKSSAITFLAFVLIWTNDTGAYLVGRWIGKHKLAPKISPKKTWEGFIGGAILTFIAAYIAAQQEIFYVQLTPVMIMAGIFSVFGPVGDLFESSLKRKAGVKDSGNIIPGHGGILDRLDGLLMASLVTSLAVLIIVLFLI